MLRMKLIKGIYLLVFVVTAVLLSNIVRHIEVIKNTERTTQENIPIFQRANVSCSPTTIDRDYVSRMGSLIKSKFDYVIITSSDWNYRGVLLNWMAHMHHLKISNYIVLSIDRKTYSLVGDWMEGGNGLFVCGCNSNNKIFEIRHRVAEVLLTENNLTVILSDGDCIWLMDFYKTWLSSYRYSVDIIAQMGKYPVATYTKYGASACAGLVIVNPTAGGKRFYHKFIDNLRTNQDDQVVLNNMLIEMNGFRFPVKLSQSVNSHINSTTALHIASPAIVTKDHLNSVQMAFLPHIKFPRIVVEKQSIRTFQSFQKYLAHKPNVWHIAPPKSSAKGSSPRIYLLKATGMFVLDSKWIDVIHHNHLDSYLGSFEFKFRDMRTFGVPVVRNESESLQ